MAYQAERADQPRHLVTMISANDTVVAPARAEPLALWIRLMPITRSASSSSQWCAPRSFYGGGARARNHQDNDVRARLVPQ